MTGDELHAKLATLMPELRAAFNAAAGCELPVIPWPFTRVFLDRRLGTSSPVGSIGYQFVIGPEVLPYLDTLLPMNAEALGHSKAFMIRVVRAASQEGKRLVWLSTWDLTAEISADGDAVKLSFRGWPQWLSEAEEKVLVQYADMTKVPLLLSGDQPEPDAVVRAEP